MMCVRDARPDQDVPMHLGIGARSDIIRRAGQHSLLVEVKCPTRPRDE
jgi:hypothetical protein